MKYMLLAIYLIGCSVLLNAQSNQSKLNQASSLSERGVTIDFYLTDDNNRMYYEAYGSGKNAILFVHGWSATRRTWDGQIDFFKDRFKVILIDLPGFGESEHNRQDWSMQHYGADVAGLCRELKLKNVYLVGWSLGTAIVMETARNLGKDAKVVILVDSMHQTDYVFDSTQAESFFNSSVASYKYFTALYKSNKDSMVTAKIISLMPPDDRLPAWWKPSVITFYKWRGNNLKECVSELKIPIRAINANNPKTDEVQWKSLYKDYEVTIFENSNHFLFWQYPQKFNETLLRIITETTE